jgi:hypothetical protein
VNDSSPPKVTMIACAMDRWRDSDKLDFRLFRYAEISTTEADLRHRIMIKNSMLRLPT